MLALIANAVVLMAGAVVLGLLGAGLILGWRAFRRPPDNYQSPQVRDNRRRPGHSLEHRQA